MKSGSFGVVDAHLRLEGRQTDQTIVVPATVHENTVVAPNDQGRREFVISSCLDEDTWLKSVTKQDLFDAHLELRFSGCAAPGSMRVSRANAISRTRLPAALFNNGVNAGELRAYRTYRQGLISFEFRPLHPRSQQRSLGNAARSVPADAEHPATRLVGGRPPQHRTGQRAGVLPSSASGSAGR